MGRHSASYISAQHTTHTRSAAAGAATFVGHVGSLALALGIGVAAAGGTGIAVAEGPSDDSAGDRGSQASADSATVDATASVPAATASPTADSPGVRVRKPGLINVPKTKLGNSRSAPGDRRVIDSGKDSLRDAIATIPEKITEALAGGAPNGTHAPSRPSPDNRPHVRSTRGPKSTTVAQRAAVDARVGGDPTVSAPRPDAAAVVRAKPSPTVAATTATNTNTIAVPLNSRTSSTQTVSVTAPAKPRATNPITTMVASLLSAFGFSPGATSTGGPPARPVPMVLGVLALVHRELERSSLNATSSTAAVTSAQPATNPVIAPPAPGPADETPTAYGDIGKWMLERDGDISTWGGQPYQGKTLLEPVNVIIVDPKARSAAQAGWRLNGAMFWSGFPAQPIHSGGFQGTIDDVTYGQRPVLPLFGYADNFFLLTNNHGRIFGPDPLETSAGYVWTGAFSTEEFTFYNLLPAHAYVSSNLARTALAMQLIMSGRATYGGMVPLDNAYNTASTTTGDHDGNAVVLVLR